MAAETNYVSVTLQRDPGYFISFSQQAREAGPPRVVDEEAEAQGDMNYVGSKCHLTPLRFHTLSHHTYFQKPLYNGASQQCRQPPNSAALVIGLQMI